MSLPMPARRAHVLSEVAAGRALTLLPGWDEDVMLVAALVAAFRDEDRAGELPVLLRDAAPARLLMTAVKLISEMPGRVRHLG